MEDIYDFNKISLNLNPCHPYLTAKEKGAVIERFRLGMDKEAILQKVYNLNPQGVDSQIAYQKAKVRLLKILERARMQ